MTAVRRLLRPVGHVQPLAQALMAMAAGGLLWVSVLIYAVR